MEKEQNLLKILNQVKKYYQLLVFNTKKNDIKN
jgi:hypothetical protein